MAEMKLARGIVAALAGLVLAGCFGNANDQRPVLGIDLYWDTKIDDPDFRAGDCDDPDPQVDWMQWALVDEEGVEVASGEGVCPIGIDINGMEPGLYTLEVDGYDDNDVKLWSSACDQIDVRRFDVFYVCDILAD